MYILTECVLFLNLSNTLIKKKSYSIEKCIFLIGRQYNGVYEIVFGEIADHQVICLICIKYLTNSIATPIVNIHLIN